MRKKVFWLMITLNLLIIMNITGCGVETASGNIRLPDTQGIADNYRTYYEVFVYSFFDSDGDGIGDLKGLTSKLDYINDGDDTTNSDLGMSGIWLMPIMPSTTYHKYDVTDYYSIDREYGTLEDFNTFLAECDKRNINVILDLVMNHTSSKHPWFVQACEYLKEIGDGEPNSDECAYLDYYHFSKEKLNEAYYSVEGTNWYYEGKFWSEMPDLNLENEKVREEFQKISEYWLDLGVSGFRLDAAKEFISDNTGANVEILTWFNKMVKEYKQDAYIVAEVWSNQDTYEKYYESGIDSVFNFAFSGNDGIICKVVKGGLSDYSAQSYGNAVSKLNERFLAYNENYIDAPFYTNHDMGRSAGYYSGEHSEKQTKIASALNLFMSGNAFVYYGEELGMKGSGKDENKRLGMLWSLDTSTEGMCQGPIDADKIKMKYDSLEEQEKNKNSIYNYYKNVIRIRNSYPEIVKGNTQLLEAYSNENLCVIKKSLNESEILIAYNLSPEEAQIDLSELAINNKKKGKITLSDSLLTGEDNIILKKAQIKMPAYSIAILE